MALAARGTEVGAARGMGQGALAGDRQNLHALIKVVGPTLYGYLFGLGAELGVPALPFLFAACIATTANLVVTISPRSWWTTPSYSDDAGFAAAAATPATAAGLERGGCARPFLTTLILFTYYAPRHLTSPTPVNADLSAFGFAQLEFMYASSSSSANASASCCFLW